VIPHGVEVFVGLEPIDLRWGFDRLAGLVGERIGRDARSGALFVFFGRRRAAIKILFFDGTGLCLLYKRLLCGGPHKSRYAERDVMRGLAADRSLGR
jgi:transposase